MDFSNDDDDTNFLISTDNLGWDNSAIFQQIQLADHFGTILSEEYPLSEQFYAEKNIGFALFGPPNTMDEDDFGYGEEQRKYINSVFKKIKEYDEKFIKKESKIRFSAMFIMYKLKGAPEEKIITNFEITKIENLFIAKYEIRKISNAGVQVVFKIPNDKEDGYKGYIDDQLRVYSSWSQYLESNALPPSIICYPKDGNYKVESDRDDYIIEDSHKCDTSSKALSFFDNVATGVALGSTVLGIASLAFPPLAPVAFITGGITGAYSLSRGSYSIYDRFKHEQSINIMEPEVTHIYLSMFGSALSLASGGASKIVSNLASKGVIIGQTSKIIVNSLIYSTVAFSSGNIMHSGYTLFNKFNNNEKISSLEIFNFASSVLFLTNSLVNIKTANQIIEDAQNETLNKLETDLNSKRLRRTFRKAKNKVENSDSNRLNERAKIIRKFGEIRDKNEYFQKNFENGNKNSASYKNTPKKANQNEKASSNQNHSTSKDTSQNTNEQNPNTSSSSNDTPRSANTDSSSESPQNVKQNNTNQNKSPASNDIPRNANKPSNNNPRNQNQNNSKQNTTITSNDTARSTNTASSETPQNVKQNNTNQNKSPASNDTSRNANKPSNNNSRNQNQNNSKQNTSTTSNDTARSTNTASSETPQNVKQNNTNQNTSPASNDIPRNANKPSNNNSRNQNQNNSKQNTSTTSNDTARSTNTASSETPQNVKQNNTNQNKSTASNDTSRNANKPSNNNSRNQNQNNSKQNTSTTSNDTARSTNTASSETPQNVKQNNTNQNKSTASNDTPRNANKPSNNNSRNQNQNNSKQNTSTTSNDTARSTNTASSETPQNVKQNNTNQNTSSASNNTPKNANLQEISNKVFPSMTMLDFLIKFKCVISQYDYTRLSKIKSNIPEEIFDFMMNLSLKIRDKIYNKCIEFIEFMKNKINKQIMDETQSTCQDIYKAFQNRYSNNSHHDELVNEFNNNVNNAEIKENEEEVVVNTEAQNEEEELNNLEDNEVVAIGSTGEEIDEEINNIEDNDDVEIGSTGEGDAGEINHLEDNEIVAIGSTGEEINNIEDNEDVAISSTGEEIDKEINNIEDVAINSTEEKNEEVLTNNFEKEAMIDMEKKNVDIHLDSIIFMFLPNEYHSTFVKNESWRKLLIDLKNFLNNDDIFQFILQIALQFSKSPELFIVAVQFIEKYIIKSFPDYRDPIKLNDHYNLFWKHAWAIDSNLQQINKRFEKFVKSKINILKKNNYLIN